MSRTSLPTPRRCFQVLLAALPLALPALSLTDAAAAPGASGSRRPCPPHVPQALDPPAEVTLAAGVAASGVQIYVCSAPKPGEAPAWVLEGPHATLSDGAGLVGIHFAGPTWQGLDGSSVKGAKLASADAPTSTAVPWLLLSGTPSGHGVFGQVTHVQRLETAGGKAPSSGCDASHIGEKVLVPYTSSYFFYRPAAPGEAVKQCRSAPPRKAS
jgi:hypothetical protein